MIDRNTIELFGYVSRLDTIQAAILSYRLKNLDVVIEKRRRHAAIYHRVLDQDIVFMPDETDEYYNTFHTFVIQVDHIDELKSYLLDHGIETAILCRSQSIYNPQRNSSATNWAILFMRKPKTI